MAVTSYYYDTLSKFSLTTYIVPWQIKMCRLTPNLSVCPPYVHFDLIMSHLDWVCHTLLFIYYYHVKFTSQLVKYCSMFNRKEMI